MNTTRILVAALLLSGMTMNASETLLKNESAPATLQFRKHQPRDVFKLNTSGLRSASARDWSLAEVTGGGLFINLGLHFPSKKFLNPYYESGDARFKLGFDFEFGNYFRFAKINDGQFGIGLRATWLSFSYTSMKDEGDKFWAMQISALRVGPQFGMALTEEMGYDVYYQIGYNFTDLFGSIEMPNENVGYNAIYTGVSHEIGAAFHYKVYSLGLGYRFGKLNNVSLIYDGETLDEDTDEKYSVNNFRVTLGFKF